MSGTGARGFYEIPLAPTSLAAARPRFAESELSLSRSLSLRRPGTALGRSLSRVAALGGESHTPC